MGSAAKDQQYILHKGILLLSFWLFQDIACALVCQYFASKTSQGFGTYLRNDMFKAINAYDYENIDKIGIPSLMTRITNDTNQLQLAVAMTIRLASRSPFLIIGSLIMAFRINVSMCIDFYLCSAFVSFIYLSCDVTFLTFVFKDSKTIRSCFIDLS